MPTVCYCLFGTGKVVCHWFIYFYENSCLLWLVTRLPRVERANQNNNVAASELKDAKMHQRAVENCSVSVGLSIQTTPYWFSSEGKHIYNLICLITRSLLPLSVNRFDSTFYLKGNKWILIMPVHHVCQWDSPKWHGPWWPAATTTAAGMRLRRRRSLCCTGRRQPSTAGH